MAWLRESFLRFFGYFGLLAAWDEGLANNETSTSYLKTNKIHSVAGASAGAMAAMLLAVGISPGKQPNFAAPTFADSPGMLCQEVDVRVTGLANHNLNYFTTSSLKTIAVVRSTQISSAVLNKTRPFNSQGLRIALIITCSKNLEARSACLPPMKVEIESKSKLADANIGITIEGASIKSLKCT